MKFIYNNNIDSIFAEKKKKFYQNSPAISKLPGAVSIVFDDTYKYYGKIIKFVSNDDDEVDCFSGRAFKIPLKSLNGICVMGILKTGDYTLCCFEKPNKNCYKKDESLPYIDDSLMFIKRLDNMVNNGQATVRTLRVTNPQQKKRIRITSTNAF